MTALGVLCCITCTLLASFFLLHLSHGQVGVLCCFALFVCLTLLASFFLPSHLSFKNMYYALLIYMYIHAVQIDVNIHSCSPFSPSLYLSLSVPIPCSTVTCQPVHHRPRASSLPPPCLPPSARQPDCRHCAITPSSSTYLAVDATTSLSVSALHVYTFGHYL